MAFDQLSNQKSKKLHTQVIIFLWLQNDLLNAKLLN